MARESNTTADLIAFVLNRIPQRSAEKSLGRPSIGIRALPCELNVSASTTKLALNEDLRYYSYKRHRRQLLTEKARENRLTKGKKILSKVKSLAEPQTMLFFSNEINICQDQRHNTQNDRWLALSQKDTPCVMQTKFSKTVMVFGCVPCDGDMMPPHFFGEGLWLNSDAYVVLLFTVVKPWITKVANGRPYVLQQDSATATPLEKVKNCCFCDDTSPNVWSTNSPDLNPMDYYVWGAVETDANCRASTTKAQLIDRIKAVFEILPRECVKSARSSFLGRIEAVIDVIGGYFE